MARANLRCIAHDYRLALCALEAAVNADASLELWSPPDAGRVLGVGYWAGLDRLLRAAADGVPCETVFNAGDAAGYVLAAFRDGLEQVHFSGGEPARSRLMDIAVVQGCRLHPGPPPALDLRDRLDPAASCRAALRHGS